MFNFERVDELFSRFGEKLLAGLICTIILSLFGTIVGLVLGIFIAYGKNWRARANTNKFAAFWIAFVRGFCTVYSVVLRGTPMMVQALIFKYGCGALGLDWGNIIFPGIVNDFFNGWFFAGLIVITFNTAAYMGEIVQSGLNGVDAGQVEGARSLGMKSSETSFFVILPQAIRNALPTIGNELIVNIKDSSVLNVIATTELYYRMYIGTQATYSQLEGYAILAIVYLMLTLIAAFVLKIIEKKLDGQKISLNPFGRWKRSLV